MTTWTIAIDWDRNDNYSGTYDDVTNRVISAKWFLGMRQAYKEDADNSTLELILSNADKLLSPENSSSPLWDGSATPPRSKAQPFRTVRIQSDDGTTRTHWLGWIESIKPGAFRMMRRIYTPSLKYYGKNRNKNSNKCSPLPPISMLKWNSP